MKEGTIRFFAWVRAEVRQDAPYGCNCIGGEPAGKCWCKSHRRRKWATTPTPPVAGRKGGLRQREARGQRIRRAGKAGKTGEAWRGVVLLWNLRLGRAW